MADETKKAGPAPEKKPEPKAPADPAPKEPPQAPSDKSGPAKVDKPAPGKDGPAKGDKPVPGKDGPTKVDKPTPGKDGPTKGDKPAPGKDSPAKDGKPKEPPKKVVNFPGGDKGDKLSQGDKGGKAAPAQTPPDKKPPAPEEPPRPVDKGKIVYLKLKELHPFHTFGAHPFKVIDSQPRMKELTASIKEQGVFTPATVRPEKDGNGYEIIAGHCRHRASELAGLEEIPCIVRDMDDHEAVKEMRDSNKQRGDPLPTELAALLALEVEDIKHQGGRLEGVAAGDRGKRSVEIVGEAHGMNYKKVMRYIRLNHLIPEFQSLVDGLTPQAKKMGFMPAVELSYLTKKHQQAVLVSMEGEGVYPSLAQAQKLRELENKGQLTGDVIDGILSQPKKEVDNVIINSAELNKYFGDTATPRQMKDQIIALLEDWKAKQPPEKGKPPKSAERS